MKKSTKLLLIVVIGILAMAGPSCIWLSRNGNPDTPQEPGKHVDKKGAAQQPGR